MTTPEDPPLQANGPTNGSDSEHVPTTDDEVNRLRQECERLTQEAAEFKDRYLRAAAELENVRRRADRERADLLKYGAESLLRDVLPALDSFERALPDDDKMAPASTAPERPFYDGLLMVKRHLIDALRKNGLEPVEARGTLFDPNIHQAVQRVESADVKEDTVGDEYSRGYRLHGRLIRPAMVSVLTPTTG